MDKNFIREKNRQKRKLLDTKKASETIVQKIKSLDVFLNAKSVLIFYPLKFEINLLPLLEVKEKKFYFPKTDNKNLLICPNCDDFEKSNFGIYEPKSNPVCPSLIDIAFIPALAVDKNLNRIGYGGGYYDRLFSNKEFKAIKIGVIQKELIEDKIKADIFDIPLDFVVTD